MTLTAVAGRSDDVNTRLMMLALRSPSLVIDCANYANAHAFHPYSDLSNFLQVHVVTVEAIYRFRDSLVRAESFARKLGTRRIIITTFHRLFNYDDKDELEDVYEHCWSLMKDLSQEHEVFAGVRHGSDQHRLSADHADHIEEVR